MIVNNDELFGPVHDCNERAHVHTATIGALATDAPKRIDIIMVIEFALALNGLNTTGVESGVCYSNLFVTLTCPAI